MVLRCTHLRISVASLEVIELSDRVCHFIGKTTEGNVKSIGQIFQDGPRSRPAVANHTICPTTAAFSSQLYSCHLGPLTW